jgi:hypothetical protein
MATMSRRQFLERTAIGAAAAGVASAGVRLHADPLGLPIGSQTYPERRQIADGKFADGRFAYTWIGGPHVVMTFDNQAWGIDRLDMVFRHELFHAFYAFDEYAGSGCSCSEHRGYLDGAGANCASCNGSASPCVMINNGDAMCASTRRQVGWADLDGDGLIDVVGEDPDTFLDASPAIWCSPPAIAGLASVVAPTNRNPSTVTPRASISVNEIVGVGESHAAFPEPQFQAFTVGGGDIAAFANQLLGCQAIADCTEQILQTLERLNAKFLMNVDGGEPLHHEERRCSDVAHREHREARRILPKQVARMIGIVESLQLRAPVDRQEINLTERGPLKSGALILLRARDRELADRRDVRDPPAHASADARGDPQRRLRR